MNCKKIQSINPKGNQFWIFIGRTDAEAETPKFWPLDSKNGFIWKAPDAGKDWRWEEKGTTKDEMVGWHHWINEHELGWTPGVGDGQGSLACCSPWGHKESDTTERLNWTELKTHMKCYWKPVTPPLCVDCDCICRAMARGEVWCFPQSQNDSLFGPLEKMLTDPQFKRKWRISCSVVSDSLRSHGLCMPGSSVHGTLLARILE